MAAKLLLDVEVVVFHVGRLDIAIKGKDVALIGTSRLVPKQRYTGGNGPPDGSGRVNRRGSHRVVGWTRVEEWRIGEMAQSHVLGKSVKEHPEAGAYYGFP